MMATYFVTWEIDINADSSEEAALIARSYQLDAHTSANVFTVYDECGNAKTVDLQQMSEHAQLRAHTGRS